MNQEKPQPWRAVSLWIAIALGSIIFFTLLGLTVVSGARTYQQWSSLQADTSSATQKEKYDASLEATKVFVSGIGTTATIIGGIVLYLNFRVANRNLQNAEKNTKLADDRLKHDLERARKESELAESRLLAERFSKAIEQLGSKNIHVRLGGLYALEKIAESSPKEYHWTVMEVLTAFIREKSPLPPKLKDSEVFMIDQEEFVAQPFDDDDDKNISLEIDVQSALSIIGRRNARFDKRGERIDLSKTNLQGANLYKANLIRANLYSSDLRSANLSHAKLQGALLYGATLKNAEITNANLQCAKLLTANLEAANLIGSRLQNANLAGAKMRYANLSAASLKGVANLTERQLKKTICDSETVLPDNLSLLSEQ